MIKIGIVGGIGSGKSYIAKHFGYPVFNADVEVNKIYKKNKKCFVKLNKIFPNYIFSFPIEKKEILQVILKNTNTSSDTDEVKSTNSLLSAFHYNFNLPLINKCKLLDSVIDPKISLRFSPNATKNVKNVVYFITMITMGREP